MTITITKKHFEEGEPHTRNRCATALAVKESTRGQHVLVDAQFIRWSDPRSHRRKFRAAENPGRAELTPDSSRGRIAA